MENLFTTASGNHEKLSNEMVMNKLIDLVKNMPTITERNGFILIPDIEGIKVYTIEEKTLNVLLSMVDYIRKYTT